LTAAFHSAKMEASKTGEIGTTFDSQLFVKS